MRVNPLRNVTENKKLLKVLSLLASTHQNTTVYSIFQIRVVSVASTIMVHMKVKNAKSLNSTTHFKF